MISYYFLLHSNALNCFVYTLSISCMQGMGSELINVQIKLYTVNIIRLFTARSRILRNSINVGLFKNISIGLKVRKI